MPGRINESRRVVVRVEVAVEGGRVVDVPEEAVLGDESTELGIEVPGLCVVELRIPQMSGEGEAVLGGIELGGEAELAPRRLGKQKPLPARRDTTREGFFARRLGGGGAPLSFPRSPRTSARPTREFYLAARMRGDRRAAKKKGSASLAAARPRAWPGGCTAPAHLVERDSTLGLVARPGAVQDLDEAGVVAEAEALEVHTRADGHDGRHGLATAGQHPRVLAGTAPVLSECRFRDLDPPS